jgi:hypothetical protein
MKRAGYLKSLNARILVLTDLPEKPQLIPLYELDLNDPPFLVPRYTPGSRRLLEAEEETSASDDDAIDEDVEQWLQCRYLLGSVTSNSVQLVLEPSVEGGAARKLEDVSAGNGDRCGVMHGWSRLRECEGTYVWGPRGGVRG